MTKQRRSIGREKRAAYARALRAYQRALGNYKMLIAAWPMPKKRKGKV